jgi:group II intron reverse transcriptase/maturase
MELIDQIVAARNLTEACKEVVRNKGAGGVDSMGVKDLKGYLDEYRQELIEQIHQCRYQPNPVRGKEIPKGNGKNRLLGIPTVIDRMLQQAVARVIMPQYEYMFSCYSYGYRPQRNTHQAVQKSLSYINSGLQHIVEIDLKGFFDEVDHVSLLQILYRKIKCKETMCLLRRWLRVPMVLNGELVKRRKGVPQGSPISPLLSNIILHELDTEMENLGLHFVRYADDFSIYCKTKSEAYKAWNTILKFLYENLKLPINRNKSGIRKPVNFHILGHGFVPTYVAGSKGRYQLVVAPDRWMRLKARLKELTRKTNPISLDERLAKLKEVYRGWINAFKYASMQNKLIQIDGWLRNRIRYCIWHHWKKPNKKMRSLIRLGVNSGMAYAWSRSRLGGWAIAQSPILGTTITVSRLRKRGYESLIEYYQSVSPVFTQYPLVKAGILSF